jgi:quinol monooxygenase YgiN
MAKRRCVRDEKREALAMLIQSVRFTFAPEDGDRVEEMFRELRAASRVEAGVVAFEVGRGQEDRNVFALWEVYRDSVALDAHKASEHFQRLVVNGVRALAKDRSAEMLLPV